MEWIELIIKFFFGFFDCMICYYYLKSFLYNWDFSKRFQWGVILGIDVLLAVCSFTISGKWYAILSVLFASCSVCFFKGKKLNKVLLLVAYVVLGNIINFLGQSIYDLIFVNILLMQEDSIISFYYIWGISLIIKGLYLYTTCVNFGKHVLNYEAIPSKIGTILVVLSYILAVVCLMEIEVASGIDTVFHKIVSGVVILVNLFTYNLMLFILLKITKFLEGHYEEKIEVDALKYNEMLVSENIKRENEIRRIKHNIRNSLMECYYFIERDDTEGLKERVTDICTEIGMIDKNTYTENLALNSVLQIKFGVAKSKGIQISHDINVPPNFSLQAGELGVLFGNLLDNAIEACEKVSEEKRQIRITVKMKNSDLILYMVNSKQEKKTDLLTTKKEKEKHGFGVSSVERIVEKYDGEILFEDCEDTFEVFAMLFGVMKAIA